MEQMNRMNSYIAKIQDFVKMNIHATTNNKKGNHVSFYDQLPSQATINPRNQGTSLIQMHNLNRVHVDEEAVEIGLAISSLRSGYPLHKSSIYQETFTIVVEQH